MTINIIKYIWEQKSEVYVQSDCNNFLNLISIFRKTSNGNEPFI